MIAMEMRDVLADSLAGVMRTDPRVVVINADLGSGHRTAGLAGEFPDRVFDVGVQEANMAGVAAGMAAYGRVPFIVSFAPFATRRIADQLMVSIFYAHTNVKVIGGDPGIAAELNGGTHMTFEDVGMVRSIPQSVVAEPADAAQLAALIPDVASYGGPVYMRTFRKQRPELPRTSRPAGLFGAETLRRGSDVTILASGILVAEALRAADMLAGDDVDAEVINVATVKPLDEGTVLESLGRTGLALTCENHNIIGGLGSAVAELTTGGAHPVPVVRVGSQDEFGEVGKLPYLQARFGMTGEHIAAVTLRALRLKYGACLAHVV